MTVQPEKGAIPGAVCFQSRPEKEKPPNFFILPLSEIVT